MRGWISDRVFMCKDLTSHRILVPTLILGLIAVIYAPYVWHGGWLCDDWMVVERARHGDPWWTQFQRWFPLFAARPLGAGVLATIGVLYRDQPMLYIISQITLLGIGWGLLGLVWRKLAGAEAGWVLLLLIPFPSVASTLIFSPAMQHIAAVCYILWAASFGIHLLAWQRRAPGWLVLSGLLIFVGLLIYEVFLPLLVFQCLLPWYAAESGKGPGQISQFRKSRKETKLAPVSSDSTRSVFEETADRIRSARGLPFSSCWWGTNGLNESRSMAVWSLLAVVTPVLAGAIVQKMIMPAFFPDISRLAPGGWGMAGRAAAYWLFAVTVQPIVLWFDALLRLGESWDLASGMAFTAVVVALLGKLQFLGGSNHSGLGIGGAGLLSKRSGGHEEAAPQGEGVSQVAGSKTLAERVRRLGTVCLLAAGSSSLLYVLSASYATVSGYDNRRLSSFWVAVALFLSTSWASFCEPSKGKFRRILAAGLVVGVGFLNLASFLLQRNNHLACWQAQLGILQSLKGHAGPLGDQVVSNRQNSVLLVGIPPAVPTNHNDEGIFTRPWDMAAALRWTLGDRVTDAVALYPWLHAQNRLRIESPKLIVDGFWEVDISKTPTFFVACQIEQHRLEGWGGGLARSVGRGDTINVVKVVGITPVFDNYELEDLVMLAVTDINNVPRSLPNRATEIVAEWFRERALRTPSPHLPEGSFRRTIGVGSTRGGQQRLEIWLQKEN